MKSPHMQTDLPIRRRALRHIAIVRLATMGQTHDDCGAYHTSQRQPQTNKQTHTHRRTEELLECRALSSGAGVRVGNWRSVRMFKMSDQYDLFPCAHNCKTFIGGILGVVLAVSILALAFWDTILLWCAFFYYGMSALMRAHNSDTTKLLIPWFHGFSQIANTASVITSSSRFLWILFHVMRKFSLYYEIIVCR